MAIFHLSIATLSRSHGRNALAAAAYRSATRLVAAQGGEIFDYSGRRAVAYVEIVLPPAAPDWAADREALWNAVERAERRQNSTVAREFVVALPAELTPLARQALTLQLAGELAARHQCAVDVAIHRPRRAGDTRNHHAHLLCSTRRLNAAGFHVKTRELDDRRSGEVAYWRQRWAMLLNAALACADVPARVDPRSLKAQGIARTPTVKRGVVERGP